MLRVGIFVLTLCVFSTEALRHDGVNVCSRTEERVHRFTVEVVKRVIVLKKVRCWDYTKNFMCDRRVYEDQPVEEERTKVTHVPVFFCCPGYKQDGDECVRETAQTNHWTASPSGCKCYFNPFQDCACCAYGGCQCGYEYPDRCVQCGYGFKCHPMFEDDNRAGIDAWTLSETGCACDGSQTKVGNCPCCQNRGCQCKEGNTKRCTQCGFPQACIED